MNSMGDAGRIQTRVRELSKSLLGGQFRAEVAAFIGLGEPPFWARRMARELEIPENKVSVELSRFATDGLLLAMPSAGWDRRTLYDRTTRRTVYWDNGLDLIRMAVEEQAGGPLGVNAGDALGRYLKDVGWNLRSESTEALE